MLGLIDTSAERIGAELRANQHRRVRTHRVADAELVENVGVVDRQISDDHIRGDQLAEHVFADVPLIDERERGAPGQRCHLHASDGRLNQVTLHGVEVDALARSEGADDEDALEHHGA